MENYLFTLLPTLVVFFYAIFTLIKAYIYLKKYPEQNTMVLLNEIMFYPLVSFLILLPNILKRIYSYFDDDIQFPLQLIDSFFKQILGTLICFVFYWYKEI